MPILHSSTPTTSSPLRLLHHLRLSRRTPSHSLRQQRHPAPPSIRNYASTSKSTTSSKPNTLEKPARFNPPSHGSRRVRPRSYPGPRLSEQEVAAKATRRYPNMMPPRGSFMHWFLTNRAIHLWITMSTLTALAGYTMLHSFLTHTQFRDELPPSNAVFTRPLSAISQFLAVYKKHVAAESEAVAAKRAKKVDDARRRKEFMREHGVEPGFLTGGWMDKFGTVEGDKFRAEMEAKARAERGEDGGEDGGDRGLDASPIAGEQGEGDGQQGQYQEGQHQQKREKRRVKKWLGIWE